MRKRIVQAVINRLPMPMLLYCAHHTWTLRFIGRITGPN